MPRYTFNWNYRSGLGVGIKGETADMPDDLADAINRDSPGVLTPFVEPTPEPEKRSVEEPPHDRMVRGAQKRGGQ